MEWIGSDLSESLVASGAGQGGSLPDSGGNSVVAPKGLDGELSRTPHPDTEYIPA